MTVHMLRQPGAGECVRTYGRQGPFQASDPRPMLADMHLVARSTEVLYDLGVRVCDKAGCSHKAGQGEAQITYLDPPEITVADHRDLSPSQH